MSALFDALRLGESRDGMLACNLSSPRHFRPIELGHSLPPTSPSSASGSAFAPTQIHVSAADGDDTNPGTEAKPLRSLPAARDLLRRLRRSGTIESGAIAEVMLRGTFYLDETLELSSLDGFTSWIAAEEGATISGGTPLDKLSWQPTAVNGHNNVFKTALPRQTTSFDTLFDGEGHRLVRARFPNGDLEKWTVGGGNHWAVPTAAIPRDWPPGTLAKMASPLDPKHIPQGGDSLQAFSVLVGGPASIYAGNLPRYRRHLGRILLRW